jgi:hypothetical protein
MSITNNGWFWLRKTTIYAVVNGDYYESHNGLFLNGHRGMVTFEPFWRKSGSVDRFFPFTHLFSP